MATNNQRAISWPSQHSSQMQSTVLISIIAIPSPPASHSLPYPCFPVAEPSTRARLEFFRLHSEGRRSFPIRIFGLSPQDQTGEQHTGSQGKKLVEGIFICEGLPGRQEGLLTCKKPPQEEKAGTGDSGVTLFIWCRPGTAPGLPQAAGPAGRERGRRCAEPLTLPCPCAHALRRCAFKQRKLHNPSPSVSVVCIPPPR